MLLIIAQIMFMILLNNGDKLMVILFQETEFSYMCAFIHFNAFSENMKKKKNVCNLAHGNCR